PTADCRLPTADCRLPTAETPKPPQPPFGGPSGVWMQFFDYGICLPEDRCAVKRLFSFCLFFVSFP
ncbi:MAG: hypothetical protein MUC58_13015, partial [Rhizobiaceae bacterium]|nr:hypothetical protein [Rhizobiaceae bacterium]